jgi:ribosome maturation factor RimP
MDDGCRLLSALLLVEDSVCLAATFDCHCKVKLTVSSPLLTLPIAETMTRFGRELALLLGAFVLLLRSSQHAKAFGVVPTSSPRTTAGSRTVLQAARKRSTVRDTDGSTPVSDADEVATIDPSEIDELRDVDDPQDLPRPIAHQPWRRGETAGCEAPIAAEWRTKAADIITQSASLVGGQVLDVTWYATQVVVTLDEDVLPPRDFSKAAGPVIEVIEPSPPLYHDPSDPSPDDIWADTAEGEILYQRETDEEAMTALDKASNMYSTKDADDPVDEPHNPDQTEHDDLPLFLNEETRDDMAVSIAEQERDRYMESEQGMDIDTIRIDKAALSTIAKTILDALQDYEEELQVLSRHELLMTSPGPSDVIETQRQFDAYRGENIIVETQDPFNSNRTLKGQLVDRNALDLMLNKQGRLVTIPLNFVKCVRLPPTPLAA